MLATCHATRWLMVLTAMFAVLFTAPTAAAQVVGPPLPSQIDAAAYDAARPVNTGGLSGINPLSVLGDAGNLVTGQGFGGGLGAGFGANAGVTGEPSAVGEGRGLSVAVNVMLLLTVITLAPSIMLMTTCFVRILVVLSLLKQAMGTQSLPPAQVVTGLALFMTAMVMAPTVDRMYNEAIGPFNRGEIRDYGELWDKAKQPIRDYMFDQIEATGNWSSVYMLLNYRGIDTSNPGEMTRADVDMITLVPAYMLSELKIGFLMGFRVYLPFLVIDMVIASLLISMSMMMLPPVLISLPFKLLLFILVDGWTLVVGSLLESFVQEGMSARASAHAVAGAALPLMMLVWRRGPPGGAHALHPVGAVDSLARKPVERGNGV